MASRNQIKWLLDQIPGWEADGILNPEAADALRERYPLPPARNSAYALISIIGTVMVGVGIISLFAYNWEDFSRLQRALISMLPVLGGVVLYSYTRLRKADQLVWTESSSVFLMLALGAGLGLINQTYHIEGLVGDFIFTWLLLSLPLLYLIRSTTVTALYLMLAAWWPYEGGGSGGESLGYWLFLLAALPALWPVLIRHGVSARKGLLGWALVISTSFGMAPGCLAGHNSGDFFLMAAALLLVVFYLLGIEWEDEATGIWSRPFRTGALLALTFLSIGLIAIHAGEIFDGDQVLAWENAGGFPLWAQIVFGLSFLIPLGLFVWQLLRLRGQGRKVNFLVVAFLPVMGLYVMLGRQGYVAWADVLLNVWFFLLGLNYLLAGIRQQSQSLMNAGLFLISSSILIRFFSSDWSFLVKGLIFILIGVAFLVANARLMKLQKKRDE